MALQDPSRELVMMVSISKRTPTDLLDLQLIIHSSQFSPEMPGIQLVDCW